MTNHAKTKAQTMHVQCDRSLFLQNMAGKKQSATLQLELTEHITRTLMGNLSSSRASHIHILPQFCDDSACRLVFQR